VRQHWFNVQVTFAGVLRVLRGPLVGVFFPGVWGHWPLLGMNGRVACV